MAKRGAAIVILGGGFGGLTAANELRRQLGKEHSMTLIDKKSRFFMGLGKLAVLAGRRQPGEGEGDLRRLDAKGIRFAETAVVRIDAVGKTVNTGAGDFAYDYLIIALGADLAPGAVPGFLEGAHNFYTVDGAVGLRDSLQNFNGGKLVVMISSMPFKCPSAPYEAAMIMDEILRKRGVRAKTDIQIFTPEPQPLPIAGPAVGAQVKTILAEKGIGFNPGCKPKTIDAKEKTISFENGTSTNYALLAGVPAHVVPHVIKESGLAGPSGWIPVDRRTLQTGVPNVYAVGDVAAVMTANNLPMPKVGFLAEDAAKTVASNIANQVLGVDARTPFEARGMCFVEVGGGMASLAQGEFLAEPAPRIVMEPPSAKGFEMKKEFEASRLAAWL